MKPFNFYIIITPGSLRFLKFAVWSINRRSDIKITLVSNGLSEEETLELKAFCEIQLECNHILLNTNRVLGHGLVLNILLETHEDQWFCFCDSDIVSLNPEANDMPKMNDLHAISSCDAMFWNDNPVKGVLGRCNRWPDGSINLSSFFCIYRTKSVKNLIKKYKIGFENIPVKILNNSAIKEKLEAKGVSKLKNNLDTGKVINVALEIEGKKVKHVNIDSLSHIGGLSSWILKGDKNLINSHYYLTDADLYHLAEPGSWLYNKVADISKESVQFYLRRQQRLAAARYFFQLISHYESGTPKPSLSLSDTQMINKISEVTDVLDEYFHGIR